MSVTFEIKNSFDLYKKLQAEFVDLKKDELSSRHAINCAMTAWHLTDWTFIDLREKHGYTDKGEYRNSLNCPSLKIMHDIANGGKHLELTRPKAGISDTVKTDGDFSRAFSKTDFLVGSLDLIMEDGTKKDFFDEITIVVEFWENYLSSNSNEV